MSKKASNPNPPDISCKPIYGKIAETINNKKLKARTITDEELKQLIQGEGRMISTGKTRSALTKEEQDDLFCWVSEMLNDDSIYDTTLFKNIASEDLYDTLKQLIIEAGIKEEPDECCEVPLQFNYYGDKKIQLPHAKEKVPDTQGIHFHTGNYKIVPEDEVIVNEKTGEVKRIPKEKAK